MTTIPTLDIAATFTTATAFRKHLRHVAGDDHGSPAVLSQARLAEAIYSGFCQLRSAREEAVTSNCAAQRACERRLQQLNAGQLPETSDTGDTGAADRAASHYVAQVRAFQLLLSAAGMQTGQLPFLLTAEVNS